MKVEGFGRNVVLLVGIWFFIAFSLFFYDFYCVCLRIIFLP